MRLKSQALRQMLKKLALMLKQKEEVGDILTEIDFQQLKIENAERIEKIEDRNKDFFRLKTNGTVTTHVFNHYKVRYIWAVSGKLGGGGGYLGIWSRSRNRSKLILNHTKAYAFPHCIFLFYFISLCVQMGYCSAQLLFEMHV